MYCRNCGKEVHPQAIACPGCGVPPLLENKFCQNCGVATQPNQILCVKCGLALQPQGTPLGGKDKIAAGLLAIFLGWIGVHKFYLGYTKSAVTMIIISLVGGVITCGIAACVMSVTSLPAGNSFSHSSCPRYTSTSSAKV